MYFKETFKWLLKQNTAILLRTYEQYNYFKSVGRTEKLNRPHLVGHAWISVVSEMVRERETSSSGIPQPIRPLAPPTDVRTFSGLVCRWQLWHISMEKVTEEDTDIMLLFLVCVPGKNWSFRGNQQVWLRDSVSLKRLGICSWKRGGQQLPEARQAAT